MARLIDEIRSRKRFGCPWFVSEKKEQAWVNITRQLQPMLANPQLPVILCDNVADYYYQGTDQEQWNIPEHFVNLAPPFHQCWMEHRMPTQIISKECGTSDLRGMMCDGRAGVLVTGIERHELTAEGIHADTKWVLWFELFLDYGKLIRRGEIDGPNGSMFMQIDANGALLETPFMQPLCGPEYNEIMRQMIGWLNPFLLTITFLHCKNVTMAENHVDKPLAKKYHAKTGVWPTKYRTLVIEPLKNILRTQGRSGEHGLPKAMHICRGHFRDYREGPGLFGKYKALVWTPMTLRGSRKPKEGVPPREIEVKV